MTEVSLTAAYFTQNYKCHPEFGIRGKVCVWGIIPDICINGEELLKSTSPMSM